MVSGTVNGFFIIGCDNDPNDKTTTTLIIICVLY